MIQLLAVPGLPEVQPGDDVAELIHAHAQLQDGDIVVVSQKIISKAEGALTQPLPGEDRDSARRRLARAGAARIVADSPRALVVETSHGLICANGGIDASNVPGGQLALLPDDPDASARGLREELSRLAGVKVAVLVADTFGRPWRMGQTDVAIGVAGIAPIRDERGGQDRHGTRLEVTEVAIADEITAAADLVRRKADGVPVVIVRGLPVASDEEGSARMLLRPAEEDLFPRGIGGLAEPLSELAGSEPEWQAPVAPDDVRAVLAALRSLGRAVPGQDEESAQGPTVFTADGLVLGVLAGLLADRGYTVRLREHGGVHLAAGLPARPPR